MDKKISQVKPADARIVQAVRKLKSSKVVEQYVEIRKNQDEKDIQNSINIAETKSKKVLKKTLTPINQLNFIEKKNSTNNNLINVSSSSNNNILNGNSKNHINYEPINKTLSYSIKQNKSPTQLKKSHQNKKKNILSELIKNPIQVQLIKLLKHLIMKL